MSDPVIVNENSAATVEVKVETVSLPSKVQDTPMASVKKVCGMCGQQEGKYKCSRCEIP